MNDKESNTKITAACPSGHRLRGGVELAGKRVKCPKCNQAFVFAPSLPDATDESTLTQGKSTVTESGVMRILGEMSELPPPPEKRAEASTRPCSRCGVKIHETLTVCPHCNCYIGVMPVFMKQMSDDSNSNRT